jgi:hypothetical protein
MIFILFFSREGFMARFIYRAIFFHVTDCKPALAVV